MRKLLSSVLAIFVFGAGMVSRVAAETPEVLRVSAIPDENPQELLRIYAPFTEYLSKELGMPVKFVPVIDYAATVEGLAAKKLDLVWYGGFTSVQAVRRTEGKATRLVMREGDAVFKSVFVTRPDTGITKLSDLKGKTFSFGSVSSTSGHLMPRYFLLKSGINPDQDFAQRPAFSGAHDATALWVEGGKVDAGALNFLVWYGGFTSVQAVRRTEGKATRLVMREGDAVFKSVFVTRPDTGITKLSDLKGKTFSFGSVSSTSGHLMPRYFLLKSGINPDQDFAQRPAFSGAHDATALWVEGGKVDAGALNFLVWEKLVKHGKVDTKKVKVFWTTPPYVDYVWTVRSELDPVLRERITAAFLKLKYDDPAHRKLLDLHRTKGYIPAKDEDWKGIEDAAKAAGLLK